MSLLEKCFWSEVLRVGPSALRKRADYMKEWSAKHRTLHGNTRGKPGYRPPDSLLPPDKLERKRAVRRASYQRNKAHVLEYQKQYRAKFGDYISDREKLRRTNDPELKRKKAEEYQRNKDRYKATAAAWRKQNPDWAKNHRKENPDRIRARARAYATKKFLKNPALKAAASMRSRVWSLLKAKDVMKIKSLGLRSDVLKAHLEALFQPGMTWENYGPVWHVDHIVPCSSFDFTKEGELEKCFAMENLQPLWSEVNLRKHNKLGWSKEALLVL